jgi:hypothetical protein
MTTPMPFSTQASTQRAGRAPESPGDDHQFVCRPLRPVLIGKFRFCDGLLQMSRF